MTRAQLSFEFGSSSGHPVRRTTATTREGMLASRISRVLGNEHVELVLTDNFRRMISSRRLPFGIEVRLHHMFLDAPEPVIEQLLAYLHDHDARAARAISRFIEQNRERITKKPRRILLRTRGKHHDLGAILTEVGDAFFGGVPEGARITWGKMPPGRSRRRSIRLGTYTHDQKLIRVHPALDQEKVPRFFVAFVVFHELLHHVVPPRRSGTRVEYHGPESRARERAHPDYLRATAWEAEHIDVLLRFRG